MQKRILITIGIIILAAIIGGAFLWAQKSKTPLTDVQTEDWKTYSNAEYGFEFKYPGQWNLYEWTLNGTAPEGCFIQGKGGVCANFAGRAISFNIINWDEDSCKRFWVGAGGNGFPMEKGIEIGSQDFYYGSYEDMSFYHLFHDNNCLEIVRTNAMERTNSSADDLSLSQILPTFKFTK